MAAVKKAGVLVVAFSARALVPVHGLSPRAPSPQESNVSAAPGPLSAFHAERPGIKTDSSCHPSEGEITPAKCLSCHDEIASPIKEGRGFHRDKTEGCGTCHAEHQGPDAKLVPLDPDDFDYILNGSWMAQANIW